jgi:GMP synthase (glutamine-hydrolysing)
MSPTGDRRDHRTVRVVQHVAPEGPGLIEAALRSAGVEIELTRVHLGEPVPDDLGGASGLVVMGGPMGVYEADRFSHLRDEQRLIERALDLDVPVLGVCLGSELLAATLGARVYPGPQKEIGFFPVSLEEAARADALFADVEPVFTALHWHGDVFDLPTSAVSLAHSALTPHQGFRWGRHAYGLLFHLEATESQVRQMTSLFDDELRAARVDARTLLDSAPAHLATMAKNARSVFERWTGLLAPG